MGIALNRIGCVLLSALLWWPATGISAEGTRISGQEVVELLQEQGYRAKLSKDDDGDPLIESSMNGLKVFLYFYDCEAARCGSLQFAVALDLEDGIGDEAINDFNRKYRYGRAYLDDEKDPFLQYDFEVLHADHEAHIVSQLDIWQEVLGEFATAVGFRGGASSEG